MGQSGVHADELPNPSCPPSCAICNDLRADGAGESALNVEPTSYVLTRETEGRNGESTPLRVYASEGAASEALSLCQEVDPNNHYRVHAVPRVE